MLQGRATVSQQKSLRELKKNLPAPARGHGSSAGNGVCSFSRYLPCQLHQLSLETAVRSHHPGLEQRCTKKLSDMNWRATTSRHSPRLIRPYQQTPHMAKLASVRL